MNGENGTKAIDDIISSEVLTESEQLQDDIRQAEQAYLAQLNNDIDITQVDVFNGLIAFIRQSVFDKYRQGKAHNPILENIPLVSLAWDEYTSLCARYYKTTTIVQFSSMLDISPSVFNTWVTGQGRGTTKACYDIAQKIYTACESAALSKTVNSNGIGAMFLLKSKFGYQEQAKQVIEIKTAPQESAQEIAARYADLIPAIDSPKTEMSDSLQDKQTAQESAFS